VDDEIDFDPSSFRYANIGGTRHLGVEASLRWSATPTLQPFCDGAWTDVAPRDGPNAGRQLKNVPRFMLRGGLAVSLPGGFAGEAVVTRLFGRFADDAESVPLANGWLLGARLERRFGAWALRLDGQNLAGVRTDEIGFVLADFSGGSVPYRYPGARRRVVAGVAITP